MSSFLSGNFQDFNEFNHRLENVKVGNVRSLLNQEQVKLKDTEGDQFNRKFNMVNRGDDDPDDVSEEEEEKDEYAP